MWGPSTGCRCSAPSARPPTGCSTSIAHIAREYRDEVDAVERVRAFMHARLVDRPAQLRIDDVLFTFALVLAAIERDLAPLDRRGPTFAAVTPVPRVTPLPVAA
jgi:hypothetical protein